MRIEFNDCTLLLRDAPEEVPYAEWDGRIDEYRAQAYQYRTLLEWAGTWTDADEQATLRDGFLGSIEDAARDIRPPSITTDGAHSILQRLSEAIWEETRQDETQKTGHGSCPSRITLAAESTSQSQ